MVRRSAWQGPFPDFSSDDKATQTDKTEPESHPQEDARSPQDVAAYVAHMTGEMATMARGSGFDLLAYFLDMARIEAKIQAGRETDDP